MEKNFSAIFSTNLNHYLKINKMTQAEFANRMNVSAATVSHWCKGLKLPRMDKVDRMCSLFDCYRSDLLEDKSANKGNREVRGIQINVLGRVAAGIPISAVEDIIDTEEISEAMASKGEYFGLLIKGDSMEPRIYDGDVVIVRQQDDAESGEIVIALVNGNDATCKRLLKYAGGISLISLNSKYEPMMFTNQEVIEKPVKIIGKVVELRGKL